MTEQYVGEIRLVGFNFVPEGWLPCDGSLQSTSTYDTLFALIGTTYGGDGNTTFAMPDLRGRVPVDQGTGGGTTMVMAQQLGSESVTLTSQQVGSHNHLLNTGPTGNSGTPAGSTVLADIGGELGPGEPKTYGAVGALAAMAGQSIGSSAGGGQPHENRQPLLTVNYIISPYGVYPTQN